MKEFLTKTNQPRTSNRQRANPIPKLIDNKQKNLECNLYAHDRDSLLLKEAKDDAMFRKEMCQVIRESNNVFAIPYKP